MNDLSMETAPAGILSLDDDELDHASGGIFPIVVGVLGISFFAGAWFGTMTGQLIRAIRER